MPRVRKPAVKIESLVATIESVGQTYYISDYDDGPAGDEGIIEITGRITRISPRHRKHLDQPIEVTLACERSFRDEPAPAIDKPFLLNVHLKGSQRGCMAYLPADAIWTIPAMIKDGRITHIEARFDQLDRGSGTLRSLYFSTMPKLEEVHASLQPELATS